MASFATALDQANAAVQAALDLGINYFDTAPGYGNSEEVLGASLGGRAGQVVLSTKLGGRPDPFDPRDLAGLKSSLEESLRLLGREMIDLLIIHEPDRPGQYDWWTDRLAVEGPVLGLLQEWKAEGKIRALGVGGTSTSQMAHLCRSGKFDVVLTAFNYSLLWREAELEIFPAARDHGMGVIVGSPLQQGALAAQHRAALEDPAAYWLSSVRKNQLRELYDFVDETGLALPEVALRFLLSNPCVDCVLMGARSAEEVTSNAAVLNKGPLRPEILSRLNEIAAKVPFRPANEPMGIGWFLANPSAFPGLGAL